MVCDLPLADPSILDEDREEAKDGASWLRAQAMALWVMSGREG